MFTYLFTCLAICTSAWWLYCYRSTSKQKLHDVLYIHKKTNTTCKSQEFEYIISLSNRTSYINTSKNTLYSISVLNLTHPASIKTEFWSHTHWLLIFWSCNTVTLRYCMLAIKSEVGSERCHLIIPWQASLWGIFFYCKILLKKDRKTEQNLVNG